MTSRNLIKRLALAGGVALFLCYSGITYAAPSFNVSGVSANAAQKEISISGSGFGSGPNMVVYDTFDTELGVIGEPISLIGPEFGEWTEINKYYPPTYSGTARSGTRSVQIFTGETQKFNQIILRFTGTTEFFVSYWVYLEGPDYFPGDLVSAPKTFSEDSSFKMLWVLDQDVLGDSSDVVLPTHTGRGQFALAGNDTNLVTGLDNTWWSWDHWMRVSFWLKADPSNPTVSGVIHFDTVSKDKGHAERIYNVPIFDADGPTEKQYQQMNFPGWVRSTQDPNTNILYDDIYVSTGNNAAARVELGNAERLESVTRLDLLSVQSWTDTSIRAIARTVDETELSNMFIYITDASGQTNLEGIPLVSPPSEVPEVRVE